MDGKNLQTLKKQKNNAKDSLTVTTTLVYAS